LIRREVWLSAAAALWGLAIAISLASVVSRPAPSGQLPSYATRIGMDAHTPLRFMLLLIGIPIVLPLILRPLIRLLAGPDSQSWSARTAAWSCVAAMWFVVITRSPAWVIACPAIVWAACVALRRRALGFTRDDVILLPTFATVWLAISDSDLPVEKAVMAAALVILALRIAVSFMRGTLPPAFAFTFAPLGLLLQTSVFGDFRRAGWPSLLIAVITPFIARPLLRDRRRTLRLIAFVIYPLAVFSYSNAASLSANEGMPRVNLFEHSHPLLPASELLRGEKLYRDILPAHGMLEDGGFDAVVMRLRGATIGSALRARETVVTLGAVGIYALAAAVSGSPHVGILAYFLTVTFGSGAGLRALPALIALALTVTAIRRRDPRWFAAAAIAVGAAFITSLDYAAYSAIALVVGVLRFSGVRQLAAAIGLRWLATALRGSKLPLPERQQAAALRLTAIGAASAAAVLAIGLAIAGVLRDFIDGTFGEALVVFSFYALNLFTPPAGLTQFGHLPEMAIAFLEKSSHLFVLWVIVVIFVAVILPRRRSRQIEALLVVAVFIVVCGISYAERHHLHFHPAASAFMVPGVWLMFRRRWSFAPIAALLLVMVAGPTNHIAIVSWLRGSGGPVDPNYVPMYSVPRAGGALFHRNDVATVEAVREYVQTSLQPHETFLDFTNRGLFYFLFNRDCPIRQYEVPFYQHLEQQRDVIRRLDNNPNVRAVLVPPDPGAFAIDGIPNKDRAPLVWQYIETHFRPHYERGDTVFWRRVESSR
jgi:hypothetical protein